VTGYDCLVIGAGIAGAMNNRRNGVPLPVEVILQVKPETGGGDADPAYLRQAGISGWAAGCR